MVEVLAALRGYCMPASTREDALARIFPSVPTQVSTRGCLRVANGEDCHRASGAARTATPSSRGFVERMAYDSLQVAKLISQNVDEMKSCWEVLPETNWDGNGFPKAVSLSETGTPNVSAYLKRMFNY